MENKKYTSIDGLRTIGAIGIVAMHIRALSNIKINNYFYNTIIPFFNYAVFLFMIISGFGMCCGYYKKIKNNEISLNEFYKKRYKKILPFFMILVLIDVLVERTLSSIFEGFADLTLFFAFLPNPQMSVIGVIFAFYILFPFFVFLLDNKKRAWCSFIISLIFSCLCKSYFFTERFNIVNFDFRINIVYCFTYFILGGIIYLYRDKIENIVKNHKLLFLFLTMFITIIYFVIHHFYKFEELFTIEICLIFGSWLIYSIGTNCIFLNNKITKFISNISMEIYLCHLFIYKIIEKIGLINIIKDNVNSIFAYILLLILTLGGAMIFSIITKLIISKI